MESVMDSPDPVKKNSRNDPDVRLMLRVRRGDAEAFEQIVSGWQNRLVTLFLHHMGDHATAEDLAQEVFMRVYRSRATYKPKACFSTWIYTIANNVASDLRQRAYRRHERGISPSPGTSSGAGGLDQIAVDASGQMPSRQVDRTELRGIVQQALGSLGERQRMALLLSKFERCSYEEIAEAMNLSQLSNRSCFVHVIIFASLLSHTCRTAMEFQRHPRQTMVKRMVMRSRRAWIILGAIIRGISLCVHPHRKQIKVSA